MSMRAHYENLSAGDRIYRIPETVVEVDVLYEKVPNPYGYSGTVNQPTGKVRLVTRLASVTSVEIVDAATLVHADAQWVGCDTE